jgi:serine/threonine-protein kinase
VIGTPTYMAPEQMVSARSTDTRSDIWSMGVVMFQLLTGRPPFEAETYAQLVLKVGNEQPAPFHMPLPPGLPEIVYRCLEKKPENRIQSVGDLARMLAPYASDPLSAQQSAERASRILATQRGQQAHGYPLAGASAGLTPPPALTPKSWNATNGSSLNAGAGQVGTRVVRKGGRGLIIAGVATLCIAAGVGGFVIASSMKKGDTKAAASTTSSDESSSNAPSTTTMGTSPTGTTPTGTTPTGTTPTGTTPTGTTPTGTTDTQKTATSPTDATKTDASKTGATKTDATKTDASKTATKSDATKAAVKTDGTKTDATKTDAAKTAVKTDATKTAAKTDATKTASTKTATKTTKTKSTKTKSTSTKTKSTSGSLFDDRK